MERLLLKAATTATDQGYFTAVISAASIDREKDIVDPAGMVRALHKWAPTGKNIPLAWNHSTAPEHQIGYIDPASARVKGGEVVADGFIDQSTDSGAHAWRQVKMGTLGFSFGYLTLSSAPRKGGGRLLKELDVYEVTASPTPMNNDTRVLSWKADVATEEDEQDTLEVILELIGDFLDTEDDAADAAAARDILQRVQALLQSEQAETPDGVDGAAEDQTGKSLLQLADEVVFEHATGGDDGRKRLPAPSDPEPDPESLADDTGSPLFPPAELQAAKAGELKSVWTASYIDDLPDSCFLYVESGGSKDSDGKTTPRSLRHFPVKDASDMVDLPHLRNALARIPQSNLSQDVKDRLTAKAQRLLDSSKSVVATGQGHSEGRPVDPLILKADALALEFASDGESLRKSPRQEKTPKPKPQLTPEELRTRMRDLTLSALTGESYE